MGEQMSKQIGSNIFLKINHGKKELRFKFESISPGPNSTALGHISSLSGGEKSVAQMNLICSLWEQIQPPFRCLDEWDIFLDPLNRKIISELLYDFGKKQSKHQFIFISPQGAPKMNKNDNVSIFEVHKS